MPRAGHPSHLRSTVNRHTPIRQEAADWSIYLNSGEQGALWVRVMRADVFSCCERYGELRANLKPGEAVRLVRGGDEIMEQHRAPPAADSLPPGEVRRQEAQDR
jgi:hypothetical protein